MLAIKQLAFQRPQRKKNLSYELKLLTGMSERLSERAMYRNNWRTRLRIAHHALITGDELTTGAIHSAQVWQSDQAD